MFDPFKNFTGVVATLDRPDVDTDQIIPKQFLKRVKRSGYGEFLFYDWATDDTGQQDESFFLNQPPYNRAEILVTRQNFGCGSSREHAVWALTDFGFKTIISSSFADIFENNSFKNGLLLIELEDNLVDQLFKREEETDGAYRLSVNLEKQLLQDDEDLSIHFDVDEFRRKCLLEGLDDIQLTLDHSSDIDSYETGKKRFWQDVNNPATRDSS